MRTWPALAMIVGEVCASRMHPRDVAGTKVVGPDAAEADLRQRVLPCLVIHGAGDVVALLRQEEEAVEGDGPCLNQVLQKRYHVRPEADGPPR